MSTDIEDFVVSGSQKITPVEIARFEQDLPLVLAKVSEIDSPEQPVMLRQTQFLVRFVEDCLGGQYAPDDLAALAEALFGLMYFLKVTDIIPDDVTGGYSDDSAILRVVLSRHVTEFTRFASHSGLDFQLPSQEA